MAWRISCSSTVGAKFSCGILLSWIGVFQTLWVVTSHSAQPDKAAGIVSLRARAEARSRNAWSACRDAGKIAGLPVADAAENAWKLGRACFDLAEFSSTDHDRAELANEGIAACRGLLLTQPNNPAAHYYLAMNLGQLARTKTLGALRLVDEMEKHFQRVIAWAPKLDRGGPDRSLGLLYLEAPGWPASVGNRGKARKHLAQAVERDPEFPENHLCWMEALMKWKDRPALEKAAAAYTRLLPAARKDFDGDDWEWAWTDWDRRLEALFGGLQRRISKPIK